MSVQRRYAEETEALAAWRAALDAERKPAKPVRGTVHSASAPEEVSEPGTAADVPTAPTGVAGSPGSLTSPVDTAPGAKP